VLNGLHEVVSAAEVMEITTRKADELLKDGDASFDPPVQALLKRARGARSDKTALDLAKEIDARFNRLHAN
jgi:hypothetical protein